MRGLDPRVASLAAMALTFWLLTALSRAFISTPFASRYLYVGAFFVLLLAVQLLRGISLRRVSGAIVAVAAVAAVVSNVGALRDAGRLYRSYGQATTAVLGALDIGRPVVPPGYVVQDVPGYPFVVIPAAAYFAAAHSVGSPAATPAQILADPEPVRLSADAELIHIHRLGLVGVGSAAPVAGPPPTIDSAAGGSGRVLGGCVTLLPAPFTPAGATAQLSVTVPSQGLLLQASGSPATVGVRRFAEGFQTLGTLTGGSRAALLIAPDASPRSWHVQLTSNGRVEACGYAP